MTRIPETRYAHSRDGRVAYQVVGHGAPDLLLYKDATLTIDYMWEIPAVADFLDQLASFCRLICFDSRGVGVSDPVDWHTLPPAEQWNTDVSAVLDAAGSRRAAMLTNNNIAPLALLFAATQPQRVEAIVVIDGVACLSRAPDYPAGFPPAAVQKELAQLEALWGTEALAEMLAPSSRNDPQFRAHFARSQRLAISPHEIADLNRRYVYKQDFRHLLPLIQAPTLVLHRRDNPFIRVGHGRYLAEHIRGARYVELPGADISFFSGDSARILGEIREFLTGKRSPAADDHRVLASVLMVDIAGSTERAIELGDRRWRELLTRYYEIVRREVERFRGREVDTAGDGFFASFEGPGRALRCAASIRDETAALGLQVRSGVHTGECELIDGKVGGVAVHIGARITAHAGVGEILASSTVRDLVVGSDLRFSDRGSHALKGIPGEWRLFALE